MPARNSRYDLRRKGAILHRFYFVLFELVLLVLLTVFIFNKISDVRSGEIFDKRFFARDLALARNTLTASPFNARIEYGASDAFKDKIFQFDERQIVVEPFAYPAAVDDHLEYEHVGAFVKSPFLQREGGTVRLAADTFNRHRYDCPDILLSGKVVLDPGHGRNPLALGGFMGERGVQPAEGSGVKDPESVLMQSQAFAIENFLKTRGVVVEMTRNKLFSDPAEGRIEEAVLVSRRRELAGSAGAFVSLHAAKSAAHENLVKAYVRTDSSKLEESATLACHIVNALAGLPDIDGVAIVPFTGALLASADVPGTREVDEEDPRRALGTAAPGVLLEIADIDRENGNLFTPTTTLSKPIAEGILRAFGKT